MPSKNRRRFQNLSEDISNQAVPIAKKQRTDSKWHKNEGDETGSKASRKGTGRRDYQEAVEIKHTSFAAPVPAPASYAAASNASTTNTNANAAAAAPSTAIA